MFECFRPRMFAGAILAVFTLSACGGSGVATTPVPTPTLGDTPAAASSTFCFTPSTSAQTVALPSTGGFTGSLAIRASASAAASCNVSVTFATGSAAATPSSANVASQARKTLATTATKPILDVSMSDAFTNNVEISGATLNTPSNLSFPDGTYYAIVQNGTLPPSQLVFTATNGVLTLQTNGTPIIIVPGTTATLFLYPRGVVPISTDGATPSPGPSAAATPSATPSATPTATATPVATPIPSPTATAAIVASSITLSPSGCIQFGNAPGSQLISATIVTNAPVGTVFEYGWRAFDYFTVTVPGATQNIQGATVGLSNAATINSPGFPMGSLTGDGATASVQLFLAPTGGNTIPTPVLNTAGNPATAQVRVDAGAVMCS